MPKYQMLDKTELKFVGMQLDNVNLNEIADCVADLLEIRREDVAVIDVRNGEVALDILVKELDPEKFVGRAEELIDNVSRIEGVTVYPETAVTSHGMLGWIDMGDHDPEELKTWLKKTNEYADEARRRIAKRIIVFPSGTEVERGEIEDTNSPLICARLKEEGYYAETGPILKDNLDLFSGVLRQYVVRGFGTMITTGGVGAEDKDVSVEAVLKLDPDASVQTLVNFEQGKGRHFKSSIRIAVGEFEGVRMVTLPGPNDEVRACLDELIQGIKADLAKEQLSVILADKLRKRLIHKMSQHHADHIAEE